MITRLSWSATLIAGTLLLAAQVATADEQRVPERSEIEKKYTWATDTIFPSTAAWEAELTAIQEEIPKMGDLRGTLAKGPDKLLAALKLRDELEPRIERVYVYASLLADQDTRVSATQGMRSRAQQLYTDYAQQMSWFTPELTSIPHDQLETWMAKDKQLALYRHYFDNLFRQKAHILSPREEELIALTGQMRGTPEQAYSLLSNADIQFPKIRNESGNEVELDDSAFYLYMRSPDRRVREDAYRAIVGTYAKYRNTAAALLDGVVQNHIFTKKARGYDSCLQAALDTGNIPTEVYETLVNTVNDNLPLLHRYQQIRQRALHLTGGVKAWDLFAPFTADEKLEYEYDEGVAEMLAALRPLGGDYLTQMQKGLDSRWIDVYPTKGKRSGAYSSGTFLTQPYILLNYHGGYEDVSTLAHEMGHSMHSYYSRGTQPYVYADYDIFCAEVASTCNEILLQDHVLKQVDNPQLKLYLLVEFLESFRGTVFRQTMFSEFEQKVHEMAEAGEPLTADSLGAAYGKIMKKYYGPAYEQDPLVDNYWIRIPHFYYNFYVYKYATSFCAASNIARRITAGEPGAVDGYLKFLQAGSSRYPLEVLQLAGVDMTSPEPVQDAMKHFESLLDQTEALLEQLDNAK